MSDHDTTSATPLSSAHRKGRIKDAAKAVPFLGLALFMIPLAWSGTEEGGVGTGKLVYVFCIWIGLIVVTALIARLLREDTPPAEETSR